MAGYIGTTPVPQATQHRESFTATGGQTSFATAGYTPQFIDVYLNGVKLAPADYTATNGSDVVLASGATASDILEIVAYTPFEVANQTFTGTTTAANLTVTGAFTSQGIDDNADAVAITIDSSENVGIGTSSPTHKVHISTTDSTPLSVEHSNGSDVYIKLVNNADGAGNFLGASSNNLTFWTENAERMRITSAGNVGIGTSSPLRQLSLQNSSHAEISLVSGTSSVCSILMGDGTTGTDYYRGYIQYENSNDAMAFATGTTERMRITSDGSVAINDSSPDGKLNVVSTAHNNGSIFDSTGTTQLWLRDTDAASNQKNWGFQVSGGSLNILRANDDRASGFVTPIEIKQAPANSLVIDASGNLLVGTTDDQPPTNNDASGIALRSDGKVAASRSNGISGDFNNGSDGDIVWFRNSGTVAGRIGSASSAVLYLGSASNAVKLVVSGGVDSIGPSTTSGGNRDNAMDLGWSSNRFKDLYLSGGVVFDAVAGNATSNTLDDYEEGTWTPVSDYGTLTSVTATYTKIGNSVFIRLACTMPSTSSSSHMIIQGFPFATAQDGSAQIGYTSSTNYNPAILIQGTICAFYSGSGGAVAASTYSGAIIRFTGQYNTTS